MLVGRQDHSDIKIPPHRRRAGEKDAMPRKAILVAGGVCEREPQWRAVIQAHAGHGAGRGPVLKTIKAKEVSGEEIGAAEIASRG